MKPRVASQLQAMGYEGDVETFRQTLTEVKAELFPDWSDEALIVTRDEAASYCQAVKKKLGAPKLTRPFILTALIGVRKARTRRSCQASTRQKDMRGGSNQSTSSGGDARRP